MSFLSHKGNDVVVNSALSCTQVLDQDIYTKEKLICRKWSFPLKKTQNFIYLFLFDCAGSSLLCGLFSSSGDRGPLFVEVPGCPTAVASLVTEHRLQGTRASVVVARGFQSTGSIVVTQGLSCFAACGIFLDQGSNPCLLHWQAILYYRATREAPEVVLSVNCICILPDHNIIHKVTFLKTLQMS